MASTSFVMIISGACPFPGHHGSAQRCQRRAGRAEKGHSPGRISPLSTCPARHPEASSAPGLPVPHSKRKTASMARHSRRSLMPPPGISPRPRQWRSSGSKTSFILPAPSCFHRVSHNVRTHSALHIPRLPADGRTSECRGAGLKPQTPSPPWASGNGWPDARNPFPP